MMSTTEGELDIEVPHEREEGELEDSDVEEGTYIPLARPEAFNPPSLVHMQIQDELSDEASAHESSCSDSDEELRRRPKRTKIRPRRPQPTAQPDKKEKYNVWCKALQEDLLTEDMVTCDVNKKRALGIESYDYTIKYRLDDNFSKKVFTQSNVNDRTSNKRRNSDRSNVKLRLGKRVNSHQFPREKQQPRYLPDLTVSATDPEETVASDIAEKLNEEKMELILKIIQGFGAAKAMELFKETQRVEADGGMLVMNGTRRRTPGGIYFFLLKRDDTISQDKANQILNEDRNEMKRRIKKSKVKSREKVMEQLKQSLTDSEISSLSRGAGEVTIQSEHGSNPPPSPATDARECSSDTDGHTDGHVESHVDSQVDSHVDSQVHSHTGIRVDTPRDPRSLQDYDDGDYLEVMCNDDMDLF